MRRLLFVLALVAGVLAAATGALAAAVDGDIGIRLVDAPTDRSNDPRARIYVIDHLEPGATIERRVELSNTTSTSQDIAVYAGAATIADGSFVGGEGRTQNELSTWTSLDRGTVELAAGGTELVTVTVAVPTDASEGEQYAVVWAEARAPAPESGGVTVVNRVGIRLYIDVGPGGEPPSDFTIGQLTAERLDDGQPVVRATVTNTGGRALDLSGTLTLANGPGGLTAGPYPATLGTTLAPGDTGPVTVVLDPRLPNGPWDASIELTSGLLVRSAHATITFPEAGAAPVAANPVGNGLATWAVALGVLVLVLLLALLLLFLVRRRSRRADEHGSPHPPAPSPVGAS